MAAGVAIRTGDGWLFNAGDAYLHHAQVSLQGQRAPLGLKIYGRIMDTDSLARRANQERLRSLKRDHSGITIFCSHDTHELAALQGKARDRSRL